MASNLPIAATMIGPATVERFGCKGIDGGAKHERKLERVHFRMVRQMGVRLATWAVDDQ